MTILLLVLLFVFIVGYAAYSADGTSRQEIPMVLLDPNENGGTRDPISGAYKKMGAEIERDMFGFKEPGMEGLSEQLKDVIKNARPAPASLKKAARKVLKKRTRKTKKKNRK